MEGCGQGLVFGGHASVLPTRGQARTKQLDGHPLLSPPSLWRDLGLTATPRRNCCLPRLGRFTHLSVVSRVVRAVLVDCWTAVSVSFVLAGRPGE